MESIRHNLSGVIDIALQVDKGGTLFEHAVLIAFGNRIHKSVHVSIALTDVHIVADTDNVCHERNHISGFADGFSVGNLRLAFVQILYFQTEQVTSRRKAEPCAG